MSEPLPCVLLVEDEPQIRRFVRDALRREGLAAIEAGSAQQGLDAATTSRIDLVILDLGLPDLSGLEFIDRLRSWSSIPILILSARSAEQDKIAALDAGADDYLGKPFSVGELLARVRALLRRKGQQGKERSRVNFGDVDVDLARRVVTRAGEEVHLTQLEYRLLTVLLANDGKVMTHRQLMAEVWGPGHASQGHYLRIYVGRLRQKLEQDPTLPKFLLTETGVGYRFQT